MSAINESRIILSQYETEEDLKFIIFALIIKQKKQNVR